ncbi:protocadherin-11 X-linked-like [Babylonia areolata]|uniref:protocadherin-11 X-linked-like n=1 Tax=Babylonia areolata TaxID=304850 RepID=UPI003FD1BD9C
MEMPSCYRVRHILLLFFLLVVARMEHASAQQFRNAEFQLIESQPSGTYVGDIPDASRIKQDVSPAELATLRYKFMNPNNLQTASLFSINGDTGVIYTSAMIDRESVCQYEDTCVIAFDVTVLSTTFPFFEIVAVRVNILDINDNPPRFPSDELTLYIPEDTNLHSDFEISGALDADKGEGHSVQKYELRSDDDTFSLDVEHNLDGTWGLKIVTNRLLDREKRDLYRFQIIARDGGSPPLTGTLVVNVNVTDANDNSPAFTKNIYNVNVKEDALVGSSVGQVTATDKDAGQNAEISYRFSPRRSSTVDDLFFIDTQSGEIKVKSPLQYHSGNSFETIVEARDRGNPPRAAQAILILSIRDVGNNPPVLTITPVTDKTGGTMSMSEGAEIGTVVAHVQTIDKDNGANGAVECKSLNPFFKVASFEGRGRGFLVRVSKELDRESQQEHNVTIQCQDAGTPPLKTADFFMIRLTDENDNNPRFERQIYHANISENNKMGEFVLRVIARDSDVGLNSRLTYYISMEEQDSMFLINHDTGDITAAVSFDRETVSQMTFVVRAVDEGVVPRTGSASVVVTILDKNDNKPYFKSSMEFEVPEKLESGTRVGQLQAGDDDEGVNARIQFMELTTDASNIQTLPFIVLSDGTIRTDRVLLKSDRQEYSMMVVAKDGGLPPLNTTAKVLIRVVDSNDNKPIIEFPNPSNNTVVVKSDLKPGEVVTEIVAYDQDEGMNSRLKYFIAGGNEAKVFSIPYPETGQIILVKDLTRTTAASYALKIEVQDQGLPQQTTASELTIKVNFVGGSGHRIYGQTHSRNSTTTFFGDEDLKYIIIAGVVGGVTVIISIIIVTIIIRLRRPVHDRRRGPGGVITGVQEQGDGRHFDKQLWHSVPADDLSPVGDEVEKHHHHHDTLLSEKLGGGGGGGGGGEAGGCGKGMMVGGNHSGGGGGLLLTERSGTPDITDAYIKKHGGDQYGGQQQLYTFRKGPGRAPSEDFQSDTSGETTTSDSGRGGSEEDIQLPPLPEMTVDTSRLVFAQGPEALLKERRFMYTNTPPPEGEEISFETFSPRMLPSYGNHLPRDPAQPMAYRDVHTLGSSRPAERKSPYRGDTNGGKRGFHLYQNHPGRVGGPHAAGVPVRVQDGDGGGGRGAFFPGPSRQLLLRPATAALPFVAGR